MTPLKPLSAQTVVITGATSGIGLATARLLASRGAKLVLVARNGAALETLAAEIRTKGGKAEPVVADVGDEGALRQAAITADKAFGGFDAWVNNAGVSIFGRIDETPIEDQRRLFDTNYWGMVNGSKIALEHLRGRTGGGVLLNVGSVLGDTPVPVQGVYSASKHAVKGFTNALRMELMTGSPDVTVTLIKPSAIDTPYKEHAKTYAFPAGTNPPPVYATPLVAEAIAYALETRTREITVGFAGRVLAAIGSWFPALAEPLNAHFIPLLMRERVADSTPRQDALHVAGRDLRERAPYDFVRETSLYTQAQLNPKITYAVLAGLGLALVLTLAGRDVVRVQTIKRGARERERAKWKAREAT